jgi:signal transduction histidine kinase/DNA-binding response OmpR family regulator
VRAVVVRGAPGVGKTALLEQVLADLSRTGALTGDGKHLEGGGAGDLAPIVTALEKIMASGLEQLYEPDAGLATLAAALGPQSVAFAELGSGLLHGLAVRSSALTMPSEAVEERLAQAVLVVLRWLEGFNQPILLLIDDWGRASERCVRLYRRLLSEPGLHHLKILATERLYEASPLAEHPASWSIELSGLDRRAMSEVIGDMLGDRASEATDEVLAFLQTDHCPALDLIQSVRFLEQTGALSRDEAGWRFEASKAGLALGESLSATIAGRLALMSPDAQRLARALAVYGEAIDQALLLAASGLEPDLGHGALASLQRSGFLRADGEAIALAHDRIREAVLSSLDEADRRRLAGGLAEGLRALGEARTDGSSTMLSLRLQGGLEGIDAAAWAPLFAEGARAARVGGDQINTDLFAETGLKLTEAGAAATPAIMTEATLAAVQRGDILQAGARAERLAAVAKTPREQAEADEVCVFAARIAGDMDKAEVFGLEAAKRAGITVPAKPTMFSVALEVLHLRLTDPRRAMRAAPLSDDELTLMAPRLRVLMATAGLLHERNIRKSIIYAARSALGRLESRTALGAASCAFVCAMTGGYESAGRWAAVSDARQSPMQPNRAGAMLTSIYFGYWFTRPRSELTRRTDEIEALAYAEGDMSNAAYANRNRVMDALFLNPSLSDIAALADTALVVAARLKEPSTGPQIAAIRQIVENLMTPGPSGWRLEGEYFSAAAMAPVKGGSVVALNNLHRPLAMLEAYLAVLCGAYAETAAIHDRLNWTFDANLHNPQMPIWAFATGLGLYRVGRSPPKRQARILRRLARLNPRDHAHRHLLLEAERQRARGRAERALSVYEQAFKAAQASDCILEQGLVARAAAEGARLLGASAAASGFRRYADEIWRTVGAANLLSDTDEEGRHDSRAWRELGVRPAALNAEDEKRELELADARDTAERANRAKSRLLAAVGHELRTPLHGVAGLLDLAESRPETLDIDLLRGAIAQLTSVVGDLTDLGALDGGGLPLSLSPFDPDRLAKGVAAVHGPSLMATGRRILLTPLPEPQRVVGDQGRIGQILSNLIGNAVKHGAGDIRLILAAKASEDHIDLTFEVSDDGQGMSAADIVRLFEPFERGAGAERTEGLGLGLSIARRLAHVIGGDLSLQSAPGEGATFRLHLKLPAGEAAQAIPVSPKRGLRVLLAEDTPLSRQVLAALLRAEGCVVDEAEDGEAALSLAISKAFDIIVLDMRMPGLDGIGVAQAVRGGGGRNSLTSMAILTAAYTEDVERCAAEAGVEVVLQKPVSRAQLQHLLAGVKSGQGAPPALLTMAEVSWSTRLAELRDVLGQADADALFAQVRPNTLSAMTRIRRALKAGESLAAAQEAHRLAGLASQFGLRALGSAAQDLEDRLQHGPAGAASVWAAPLEDAIKAVDWSRFSGLLEAEPVKAAR